MRNIYKLNRSNMWSRILVLWLIFSIFVLILSSCTNSRSVRNGIILAEKKIKSDKQVKIKNEKQEIDSTEDIIIPELEEFVSKAKKDEKQPIDNNQLLAEYNKNNSRIPTLREQMKALADEQQSIHSKVNNLQTDVVEIKQTLNEIKDVLEVLDIPNKAVYRGPDDVSNNEIKESTTVKNDTQDETFILSSDEDLQQEDETFIDEPKINKPKQKKDVNKPTVKKVNPPKVDKVKAPAAKKDIEVKQDKQTNINEDYELALKLYSEKNYSQAIDKFKNSLSKSKDSNINSDCNYYIGECYFALKDYDNALSHFNKSVNSGNSKKKDNAQLMIAEANVRAGKVAEAKTAYQSLIKNYPESELIAKAKKMLQQL